MRTCKSCGDSVESVEMRTALLKRQGEEIAEGETAYCMDCANELFREKIAGPKRSCPRGVTQTRRVGDPSPGRENAVRAMEER